MHKHSVLLIEDDQYQREPMADLFELNGYDVKAAPDGFAAMSILRDGYRPCLIVLDLGMPGMSGEDFRRKQLDDPAFSSIPVLLYSNGSDLWRTAKDLGAVGHATKPHIDELLRLVALHC